MKEQNSLENGSQIITFLNGIAISSTKHTMVGQTKQVRKYNTQRNILKQYISVVENIPHNLFFSQNTIKKRIHHCLVLNSRKD